MNIAVVIPNYNRVSLLMRAINSIKSGLFQEISSEIIVVEDGSKHIPKIKDTAVTQIFLTQNGGPVRARMTGLEVTKSEFILFLDSDDTIVETAFDVIRKTILEKPGFDIYHFPFAQSPLKYDFTIDSVEKYADFIENKHRSSDYMIVVRKNSLLQFSEQLKLRIPEIWFFTFLYSQLNGYYSKDAIFEYNKHDGARLSQKRDFKLKITSFERRSVRFSVSQFNLLSKAGAGSKTINAWRRRLSKECLLSFSFITLLRVWF